jgi:hypothetical protein
MEDSIYTKHLPLIGLATDYCSIVDNCNSLDKTDFIRLITSYLPQLYTAFSNLSSGDFIGIDEFTFLSEYVDEDFYNSIKSNMATILGEDDMFLETCVEDMKFSDTPIAASISEHLADIFQSLYNCVSAIKYSDGEATAVALYTCLEQFTEYWSQQLCNVMRPLNMLRFGNNI